MAGAKVAGNPKIGQFIAKIGDQYLPFDSIDAVWKHAVHNSPTLQLAMKCVEKSKLYLGKAAQKAAHLDQAAGEKVAQLADRGLNHAKKRLGGGPVPKGPGGSGGSGAPRNHKNNNKKSNDKGKEPAEQSDFEQPHAANQNRSQGPAKTWPEFQKRMKGRGQTQEEISQAWKSYKKKHGIKTQEQQRIERSRNPNVTSTKPTVDTTKMRIKRNNKGRITGVTNTQIHHIISPDNRWTKDHDLWDLAGVNPESRWNKMILPDRFGVTLTKTERSLHDGRHLDSYSKELSEDMSRVLETGELQNFTQQQYRAELEKIMFAERKLLKDGVRKLYKD